jgi:hypothetical protein
VDREELSFQHRMYEYIGDVLRDIHRLEKESFNRRLDEKYRQIGIIRGADGKLSKK